SGVSLAGGVLPTGEDADPNTNLTVDFGFTDGHILAVGNLVFRDLNNNGVRDEGELGIDGVAVNLYLDVNSSNFLDAGDGPPIASTTTAGGGLYRFAGLLPGRYLVGIAASNFAPGGPLEHQIPSTVPV